MKSLNIFYFLLISMTVISISACDKDDDDQAKDPGGLSIYFDNKLGTSGISIKDYGDKTYTYTDENSQSYNISLFAYYISAIELEGPDGIKHLDPLHVGANAADVTGYYHVISTTPNSNVINLEGIKAGKYNKIRFTVGVGEEGVQEGAAGGVLDPANGAWFWNWNAGYIAFGVEGNASNSGQEYVDWGGGFETQQGTFAVHVGGWKDVAPAPGEDPKFVNNLKVIELDFDSTVNVEDGLTPEAHINVHFEELLKGIDFSTTYAIHRPDLGKPYAENLIHVFELDHIHQ